MPPATCGGLAQSILKGRLKPYKGDRCRLEKRSPSRLHDFQQNAKEKRRQCRFFDKEVISPPDCFSWLCRRNGTMLCDARPVSAQRTRQISICASLSMPPALPVSVATVSWQSFWLTLYQLVSILGFLLQRVVQGLMTRRIDVWRRLVRPIRCRPVWMKREILPGPSIGATASAKP